MKFWFGEVIGVLRHSIPANRENVGDANPLVELVVKEIPVSLAVCEGCMFVVLLQG